MNAGRLVLFVAASSIVLVRLPALLGHRHLLEPFTVVVLGMCIAWAMPRRRPGLSIGTVAIVFAYTGVIAVELIRGSRAGVYGSLISAIGESVTYGVLVWFAIALISSSRNETERNQRLLAIAAAPAVYCLVNALTQIAGLDGVAGAASASTATAHPASLLGYVGIETDRVQFPLAYGVNSMGVVAAAALAASALSVRRPGLPSWVPWVGIVASAYCLMLGDNRAALGVSILVIVAFMAIKPAPRWTTFALPIAVPILPLIGLGIIEIVNAAGGEASSRGASGTGRAEIWQAAWDKLLSHPSFHQGIGWGAMGHISSGVSVHYADLFPGLTDPITAPTHDLAIQTVVDGGYLALVVLVAAVWAGSTQLRRHLATTKGADAIPLIAILAVVVLSGATEAAPSYQSPEALCAALLVLGASGALAVRFPTSLDASPPKLVQPTNPE